MEKKRKIEICKNKKKETINEKHNSSYEKPGGHSVSVNAYENTHNAHMDGNFGTN